MNKIQYFISIENDHQQKVSSFKFEYCLVNKNRFKRLDDYNISESIVFFLNQIDQTQSKEILKRLKYFNRIEA